MGIRAKQWCVANDYIYKCHRWCICMKNSFIMYYDYGEHFNLLSDSELGGLIRAIYEYEKNEVIPQLDGVLKMAFSFIKCQLDIDKAKYNAICERNSVNGSKGGRPKTETNPKKPKKANGFSENPKKPKKADNDNDNDNDINTIVVYLNEKAHTKYRNNSTKTQSLIKARLDEKFTVEDFKTVIDKKCAEWLSNENMCKFLRPETLFGTKFESYLNQNNTAVDEGDG